MVTKEEINGKVWNNSKMIIGAEKIKFDGFIFDKALVEGNPIFTLMLLITADPTEKQKELLDLIDVVIEDDNKKRFYPRKEEKVEEV